MQNNNPNNYLQEDEIDLKEIFNFFINSKKILITITLVITTLGAIYTFQKAPEYKSTALIEIGGKNTLTNEKGLIEPGKDLIQDLKINFIYKNSVDPLIFRLIEKKLLQIEYISPSAEKNNHLLNEIVEYIVNRHSLLLSKITQKTKNQLIYEIESLNNQIEFNNKALFTQNEEEKLKISNQIVNLNEQIEYIKNTIVTQNEEEKLKISNQIENLNNELPSLDLKIESLNEIIVADQNNLLLLKSNAELFMQRAAQSPTLDQVIFSYKTALIDYENEKIKLLSQKVNLETQLKFLESDHSESEKVFKLSQEKDSLETQLKFWESDHSESEKVFKLSQEKDSFELELDFLLQQNKTNTQLVGEILTNEVETNKALPIFLNFIFGLFLSSVVIFINNSVKASKED